MKPLGDPRTVAGAEIQYMADSSHAHEGGHRITVAGRTILALPDGRTTARSRSHAFTRALQDIEGTGVNAVEAIVGALVSIGATNITVDDRHLLNDHQPATIASLRIDVVSEPDGTMSLGVVDLGAGR